MSETYIPPLTDDLDRVLVDTATIEHCVDKLAR
jgi:hypothetical protein